jgi:outer membrane biosynthesis protein TonB
MNSQHEQLIERFLSGTMSASERRSFLDNAERNPALKRQLQAEQLIASAVRHDRAAIPGPSSGSRAQFLSMLATVSGEDIPTPTTSGRPGSSPLRYLPGNGRTRTIAAVITGAVLIVGTLLLAPRFNAPKTAPATERIQSAPAVTNAPATASPAPAPTLPNASSVEAPDVKSNAPATLEPSTAERSVSAASRTAPALEGRSQKQSTRAQGRRDGTGGIAASKTKSGSATDTRTFNTNAEGKLNTRPPDIK